MRARSRSRLRAALAVVALLAAVATVAFLDWRGTPLATGPTGTTVEVARGEPLAAVARDLARQGVLGHPRWFVAYARVLHVDAKVRAGEYAIAPGTTPEGLLRQFASGVVIQHTVTIVEGWTFREVRHALEHTALLDNTLRGRSDAQA
ncbi:MAG TPA: endolytic transglycosylase MltG, partial [Steroidobacteraceae bacterium]|nr:endolytic transglycosylase MltG [Steroidobacteraceae bacterium]